jgi:ribosome biogenesis GTPase A
MVQWFPGHMAKAQKEISEKIKMVDIVYILLDARVPRSSQNPVLNEIIGNKPRLYLLTKMDKADGRQNHRWEDYFEKQGQVCLLINSLNKTNINRILKISKDLLAEKRAKDALKGLKPRPVRAMILGIPNVGKSTLINALVNKRVASVGDRPGITKAQQWININENFELLDTPGVLWPKFDDKIIGYHLAITGAIRDDILPVREIALYAIRFMLEHYSERLTSLYHSDANDAPENILAKIAEEHKTDEDQTSRALLQDIRSGRLGNLTWDWCENEQL